MYLGQTRASVVILYGVTCPGSNQPAHAYGGGEGMEHNNIAFKVLE